MRWNKTVSNERDDSQVSVAPRPRRILLLRHAGCYNRGCEAIVRCTSQLLRRYVPGCQIVVSVADYEADREYLKDAEPDLQLIRANPVVPRRYSWEWFRAALNIYFRYGHVPDAAYANRQEYARAHIVMHIGGDNLIPTTKVSWSSLRELAFAKQLGAKTVVWACSITPCPKPETARFAAALRKIDLITVRESATLEYLRDIGVTKNVVRVADPAFLLAADTNNSGLRMPIRKQIVGLGLSALLADKYKGYLQANVGFARWLLSSEEYGLLLVPHVLGNDERTDDRIPCRAVYEALGDSPRVAIMDASMSTAQMKGVISQCGYFVGARMHSTISSLSSFVPTLSIGYSIKAAGLNRDLLSTDRFLLDVKGLSDRIMIEAFKELRGKADDIRAKLQQTIPQSQELAKKNGEAVAQLL